MEACLYVWTFFPAYVKREYAQVRQRNNRNPAIQRTMSELILFKPVEREAINTIVQSLHDRKHAEELKTIHKNEKSLTELSKAISLYPPIMGEQSLGRTSRSIGTLVENLCLRDSMDMVFHIPSKAILGQAYSMAKVNFFYMLLYLARDIAEIRATQETLLRIISGSIFTIMAEEVFIAIISDRKISLHARTNAAFLLARLWEYRIDHGVEEFAPTLTNIWQAREQLEPVYGTMLGTVELLKLSENADPVLFEFLQRDDLTQNEVDSLQEFLMGLSSEEIRGIRKEMKKSGRTSVSGGEIKEKFRGEEDLDDIYEKKDPRRLFKSFTHRRNNAKFRRRSQGSGPEKTFEEYLMCYLLARPEQSADGG